MVLSVILKGKAENMEKREWRYSGTIEERTSIREQVHDVLARKVAEEAMVLLKNESLLPLPLDVPMALFGSGAKKTVKGGIGSGDVNNRKTISVYQGLLEAGAMITSEAWLCDYEKRYNHKICVHKIITQGFGKKYSDRTLSDASIIRSVSRREERLQNRTLPGQGWQFMC